MLGSLPAWLIPRIGNIIGFRKYLTAAQSHVDCELTIITIMHSPFLLNRILFRGVLYCVDRSISMSGQERLIFCWFNNCLVCKTIFFMRTWFRFTDHWILYKRIFETIVGSSKNPRHLRSWIPGRSWCNCQDAPGRFHHRGGHRFGAYQGRFGFARYWRCRRSSFRHTLDHGRWGTHASFQEEKVFFWSEGHEIGLHVNRFGDIEGLIWRKYSPDFLVSNRKVLRLAHIHSTYCIEIQAWKG